MKDENCRALAINDKGGALWGVPTLFILHENYDTTYYTAIDELCRHQLFIWSLMSRSMQINVELILKKFSTLYNNSLHGSLTAVVDQYAHSPRIHPNHTSGSHTFGYLWLQFHRIYRYICIRSIKVVRSQLSISWHQSIRNECYTVSIQCTMDIKWLTGRIEIHFGAWKTIVIHVQPGSLHHVKVLVLVGYS